MNRAVIINVWWAAALSFFLGWNSAGVSALWAQSPGAEALVAAYGFDEGTGGTVTDASGKQHTGTLANTTWSTAGRFGGALSFNGTNSWVTVNDTALLDLPNGLTLQAWVFPTALSGWRTAVLKERTGGLTYALYAHDNVPRPAAYINVAAGDVAASGTAQLPLNTWTHLAAAYNGSVLTMYVNGDPVGSQVVSGASLTSSGALRIGGNSVWGEFFSGLIDEVRVHNRALMQTEIQALMVTPVNQTLGFEILAYNPTLSLGLGDMDVYQFELMPLGGFTGAVVPSVTGLPPGTTGTWEPAGGPPHPGPFALVINTVAATPPGTYQLTATVVNGALSASKTLTLTVSSVPGFRVIAEPNSLIVAQGQSGEAIFEVVQENGFAGTVSMSVSVMPSGVSASFTPPAPSTTPFAGTVGFNVGSAVAPGVYPLLITATSGSLIRQASFALTVLQGGTAGSWRQQALGDTPAMYYGIIAGDIGNTGQNRVISSGGQGLMYAYTYNGTSWSVSQMPFNDPADGEMHNMAIGPGRNDGINRLYIAAVNTGRVYEVSWVNGAWQVGIIATLTGATDISIGNGRNDGVQRLYVTWMSGTTELTRTGSTWSQVTMSSNETGWVHGMDLGPGRNDGINRVYTANQGAGQVYEYSWNGSAWTKLLVGSSTDMRNVKIGAGRNDGLNRLYAASGDSNVYEYTWNGSSWQGVAIGNAGVAGVKVHSVPARTKPDNRVRIYAAASNGGVYEYDWTGSAWQTTAMGLATAYMYGLDVGDGLNKGTIQVYGSSYDGNTYLYEWVPTGTPVLVTVPNLVGQTQSAAATSLSTVGLTLGTVTSQGSLSIPIGQVIGQTPAANSHVLQGSAVNISVSSGVAAPNVVGQTQAVAGAAIVGAGLVIGAVTNASSNTVPQGSVISQNPLAGVRVNGGSSVALVVSTGPSTTTTLFPTSTTILTGTLNGGNAAALTSNNNVYFAVNSTTSGTRTTAWYGSFSTVPSTLSNLRVNYRGNNSANCTQTVAIWRWSDSTWVQLDSRSVTTTEISINNLAPSGTLANYVSGAGSGEIRIRVQCTRTTNFIARGELMSIVYDTPAGPPPPDTTAPVRSNGTPSATLAFGTTQTTLSLTTNENASCRYATSAGVLYDSMANLFTTTGGTAHSTLVTGLVNGGSYNFFVRCRDASSNANTNGDDYPISFAVSSQVSQSFQASVDFSTTQGFRNWSYLYGTATQMVFASPNWQGNETYLLLYPDGGHPGNSSDAIRRWRAPQAGTINITGRAFDLDGGCGSGVSVSIRKNGTNLWQQAIANGNATGFTFNLTTTVVTGDNIDFVINRGADNVNYCDATGFNPTVLLTP